MNLLYFIIILLVLLGLALCRNNSNLKNKKFFCILCCLSLAFLSAIRGINSISDTASYIKEYNEVSLYTYKEIVQNFPSCFSYYILCKFFYSMGLNVRIWFFVIALFFNWSVFKYIYENSENIVLSFIIYISTGVFAFSMAAMKQVLAMAFCIFAYIYFAKNNKIVVPIILIIIATTFHQSALFFIFVLFISKLKINKKWNLLFLITSIVLIINGSVFLRQFIVYLADIGNRFGHYVDDTSNINLTAFFIQLLFVIVYCVYYKYLKDLKNNGIFYITVLCLPIFFLTTKVSSFFRVGFYLLFFNYSLFPNLISKEKDMCTKNAIQISSGIVFLIYFLVFSNINYVTIWG